MASTELNNIIPGATIVVATPTNSAHPARSATSGPGGDDDARRQRLEKNRQSARECRKRKKEYMGALEQQLAATRSEVEKLRASAQLHRTSDYIDAAQQDTITEMRRLLAENPDANCAQLLQELDHSLHIDSKEAIMYHIREIKDLLVPTRQIRLLLWGLDQDDAFYDSTSFGGRLFDKMAKDLDLSDAQRAAALRRRTAVAEENQALVRINQILDELGQDSVAHLLRVRNLVGVLSKGLSSAQKARFMTWSGDNEALMAHVDPLIDTHRSEQQRHHPPESGNSRRRMRTSDCAQTNGSSEN